jgi:predicted  nucleic acid-binding Zn-ribbon protein
MNNQERIDEINLEMEQVNEKIQIQIRNLDITEQEIKDLEESIENFEIDPDSCEEQYCEMLDEQGDIEIGNITLTPSDVLRKMDPIAYRTGLSDYVDVLDIDNDPSYNELKEELSDLEDDKERSEELIEELQEELEKLEEELEDFENETEEN